MNPQKISYFFLFTVAICLQLTQPMKAEEGIKGNLVTVGWLEKNLKNSDVLILDASPSQIYSAKHIPSAINYDIFTYGPLEMPVTEIEKKYQSWGISLGKKIVIYDQGAGIMATKLFHSLYYYGFPEKDLLILDGGLYMWQQDGMPVTKEIAPTTSKGVFKIEKINEDARVELPEFLTASGDQKNFVLLEALDADWHFGVQQFFNRPGHIPNGILLPSLDFYNPDKTFKSAEEIKKMLNYLGIKPEQEIYTYCGGGVAASVPYFALKFILNYPKVKLFNESELGWLKDERELPFWTYDSPFLMRETNWLKTWGGRMMRMYGVSQVSIVDVRSANAYKQGHVPFALNISAELFKSNSTNPAKLADILGSAGVDTSHEVVIISGSGLSKESALAFVMLEKLGQKKISIFMDSMDKCAQLGFALTKDATVVGPQKVRGDLSIPTTTYPSNLHKGVIIADLTNTQGIYPKVFIASGSNVPPKIQDGKVVHVPFIDFLNADGTPKTAKDIWNILTKAGVPRYAELVCFSDDPSEAAVNYFILKLMGYPDIKVLVI
ncbi:MAG: rhodanese-like domain-containing protein [Ignavibacteriales bacterium]|nr:rhodanese-like domain-containing protein [Ignavibacteriales bacterium]